MDDEKSIEAAWTADAPVGRAWEQGAPLTRERSAARLLEAVREAVDARTSELLAVACMPGLSHGAFRLLTILVGAAEQRGARDEFFPITLTGLAKVHPGTAGKPPGYTTIIKQFTELRRHRLLVTGSVALEEQTTLHRNKPDTPILVKVVRPDPSRAWTATDGSPLTASDVGRSIGM